MKKARKSPARGPLRPMRVSSSFKDFVLDQLSGLDNLRARAMFGGVGLYASDAFFGLIATDVLYFKVDDSNRAEYEAAGTHQFQPFEDGRMSMSYYAVPTGILEHAPTLVAWARRSVEIARTGRARVASRRQPRPGRTSIRAPKCASRHTRRKP